MHPIEEKLNDFTKRFQGDIELETDLFIYCQRPRIQKERDTGSPLHFLNIIARMEQAGAKSIFHISKDAETAERRRQEHKGKGTGKSSVLFLSTMAAICGRGYDVCISDNALHVAEDEEEHGRQIDWMNDKVRTRRNVLRSGVIILAL